MNIFEWIFWKKCTGFSFVLNIESNHFRPFSTKKGIKNILPRAIPNKQYFIFSQKWKPNFPPIQVQGWGLDDNLHTFNASLIRSWRPSRYSRTFAFLSRIFNFQWILTRKSFMHSTFALKYTSHQWFLELVFRMYMWKWKILSYVFGWKLYFVIPLAVINVIWYLFLSFF